MAMKDKTEFVKFVDSIVRLVHICTIYLLKELVLDNLRPIVSKIDRIEVKS